MPANSSDDCDICDGTPAPAVQPLPPGVTAGAEVILRGRRWTLAAALTRADCRELHLFDPVRADRRVLLWPFDRPCAVDARQRLRAVRLREWAAALRRHAAAEVDPSTPRATRRGLEIMPYQIAPAMAMASGISRVLLADEVGLGKTIQAGWIVADLIGREPGAHALLAVPAGLRRQWESELLARFGLVATAVDSRWLRRIVADLPAGVSPWSAPGVYVASLDFLKRPDVADSAMAIVWDVLIVDEAHSAAAPTERHGALARIAARARRIVTITATPHTGDPAGFASVTAMGSTGADSPPLMFRRCRADVGDMRRRRHRFTTVRIAPAEVRLQRLLERYSRDVWNEATGDVEGARLAVTILRKRALSSAAAAGRSLRRRLDLLDGRAVLPRQLGFFDEDEDDSTDDDLAPAALGTPGLADAGREHRYLSRLITAAERAAAHDSKLDFLRRFLHRVPGESVVVFTEYRDTLLQLVESLGSSLELHGGLSAAERTDVQSRFNREGGLLLATDAAAEGLNLHGQCRLVVNFELPWSPARLEQRIGRVDRIGQRRTVHALTLTARDTAEDLVIKNLSRRLGRVAATLGRSDRLAAFLDEARVARIVIGGAAPDAVDAPVDATAAGVLRADTSVDHTVAANQLQLAGRCVAEGGRQLAPGELLIGRIRATAACPPGFTVVLTCAARTADGGVIARRLVVLHVAATPAKPRTASEARVAAAAALAALPDARAIVPDLDRWFTNVRLSHASAVDLRIARETFLRDRPSARVAVQAGLFDKRAVLAAEDTSRAASDLRAEHERHVQMLERSRPLHCTCEPSAVLIAWR